MTKSVNIDFLESKRSLDDGGAKQTAIQIISRQFNRTEYSNVHTNFRMAYNSWSEEIDVFASFVEIHAIILHDIRPIQLSQSSEINLTCDGATEWERHDQVDLAMSQAAASDILVLKLILVLVFVLFSSQNFYFI